MCVTFCIYVALLWVTDYWVMSTVDMVSFRGILYPFIVCYMSLFPLTSALCDHHKGFVVHGIAVSHLLYLDDLKLYILNQKRI